MLVGTSFTVCLTRAENGRVQVWTWTSRSSDSTQAEPASELSWVFLHSHWTMGQNLHMSCALESSRSKDNKMVDDSWKMKILP